MRDYWIAPGELRIIHPRLYTDDVVRITTKIDDDVASKLRPLLRGANGRTKNVVNDLLRKALGIEPKKPIELPSYNMGLHEHIDPVSFNRLGEELLMNELKERYESSIKNPLS